MWAHVVISFGDNSQENKVKEETTELEMYGIQTTWQAGSPEQHSCIRRDRKDGDPFFKKLCIHCVYMFRAHALACMWRLEVRDQLQELVLAVKQTDPGV